MYLWQRGTAAVAGEPWARTGMRVTELLYGLLELARDLRWSWDFSADALRSKLDPPLTRNPWLLLQATHETRLREPADDPFLPIAASTASSTGAGPSYASSNSWCWVSEGSRSCGRSGSTHRVI